MTKEKIVEGYCALDEPAKMRFLATTSHCLTVYMRGYYEAGRDWSSHPKQLMGANELQHNLSSELLNHVDGNQKRYPDDVLIAILFDKASHYEIVAALETSLNRAMMQATEGRSSE